MGRIAQSSLLGDRIDPENIELPLALTLVTARILDLTDLTVVRRSTSAMEGM